MFHVKILAIMALTLTTLSPSAFAGMREYSETISRNVTEASAESLYISTRRGRALPDETNIKIASEAINLVKSVAHNGYSDFYESLDKEGAVIVRSCDGGGVALVAKIGLERCLVALVTKEGKLKARLGTEYEFGAGISAYVASSSSIEIKYDNEIESSAHSLSLSSHGYIGAGGRVNWLDIGFNYNKKVQLSNFSSGFGYGGSWVELSYSIFDGDDADDMIEIQLTKEFVDINL